MSNKNLESLKKLLNSQEELEKVYEEEFGESTPYKNDEETNKILKAAVKALTQEEDLER